MDSPKEETRHSYAAARKRRRVGDDQEIIFYFILEKGYEQSKPFLFEAEATIHSSEIQEELVQSLPKGKDGVKRLSKLYWMQKIVWKYLNSFIVPISQKHLQNNYLYYQFKQQITSLQDVTIISLSKYSKQWAYFKYNCEDPK